MCFKRSRGGGGNLPSLKSVFQKVKQCFLHHVCHLWMGNLRGILIKPTVQNSSCFAGYFSRRSSVVPRSPSAMVQPEPRAAWKAQRRMEECVPSLKGKKKKNSCTHLGRQSKRHHKSQGGLEQDQQRTRRFKGPRTSRTMKRDISALQNKR